MSTKKKYFQMPDIMVNWVKELILGIPLVLIVYLALQSQLDIIPSVFTTIAVGLMTIYMAHIVRKLMFTEMSITKLYKKALETSVGASIAFASLIAFIITVANILKFN